MWEIQTEVKFDGNIELGVVPEGSQCEAVELIVIGDTHLWSGNKTIKK
jgi:hypothetical protein